MTPAPPSPPLDDDAVRRVIGQIEWLTQMGSLAEATAAARALAERIPDDPRADAVLGLVLAKSKRTAEAVGPLSRAAPHFPGSFDLHFHHGVALYNIGRMAEAETVFRRALAIKPREPHALQNLGAALSAQGRVGEARAVYEQLLAVDPRAELAWLGIADSHRDASEREPRRAALERALAINPANLQAKHMLDATLGHTPERPDWRYVGEFFDSYAERFETHLVDTLQYVGHRTLANLLRRSYAERGRFPRILDVGCGTGLLGAELRAGYDAAALIGVDLSPRMIEAARGRGIYSELHQGEATQFVRQAKTRFDLIAAADVLIYIGALDELFGACAERLTAQGVMAFFVELLGEDEAAPKGYLLRDSTRFGHRRDYLIAQAARLGLSVVTEQVGVIRRHAGRDELGLYMLLEKSGA